MTRDPSACVFAFIDAIDRHDIDQLAELMTEDHTLIVFDEAPLTGLDANVSAWRGYADSFPNYEIVVHQIAEHDGTVAVLGHTTGSHLGLPDDEERDLLLIWVAEVVDGQLRVWRLVKDTPDNRQRLGLNLT